MQTQAAAGFWGGSLKRRGGIPLGSGRNPLAKHSLGPQPMGTSKLAKLTHPDSHLCHAAAAADGVAAAAAAVVDQQPACGLGHY